MKQTVFSQKERLLPEKLSESNLQYQLSADNLSTDNP